MISLLTRLYSIAEVLSMNLMSDPDVFGPDVFGPDKTKAESRLCRIRR